jgi:hypothetical protein
MILLAGAPAFAPAPAAVAAPAGKYYQFCLFHVSFSSPLFR